MPGSEVENPLLGDHPVHGTVVLLDGHAVQDVLCIHQRDQSCARSRVGERPVVVTATASQSLSGSVHGDRGNQDEIGVGDELRTSWFRRGDGNAEPARDQVRRPGVLCPSERPHRGGDRQENTGSGSGECVEKSRSAGLVVVGDIGAHHRPGGDDPRQVAEDCAVPIRTHRRRYGRAAGQHHPPEI